MVAIARAAWLGQPHRPCFVAAALVWAGSAVGWAVGLAAATRPGGAGTPWGAAGHALAFVLGAMPLFIAGFVATAGPKWLGAAPLGAGRLVPGAVLGIAGWAGVGTGVAAGSPAGIAAGLALAALGWGLLVAILWRMRRGARNPWQVHALLILGLCGAIPVALVAAAAAAARDDPSGARAVAVTALWALVVPIFTTAAHRLLPFFELEWPVLPRRAGPAATLALLVAAPGLAALAWHGIAAFDAAAGLAALACAAVGTAWSLRWARHRARRGPMVAMLHRALVWWTLAWAARALAAAPGLDTAWRARLEAAGLHALGLGFLGGTMLAMVTRVTAAHAGRAWAFDAAARALEGLLQAVVLLRVAAALYPGHAPAALALAGAGWALLAALWLLLHAHDLLPGRPAGAPDRSSRSGLAGATSTPPPPPSCP